MLVGPDYGRINQQPLQIGILQLFKDRLPTTRLGPAIEPLIDAIPVAKASRQITPLSTGASHPQHGIKEESIVFGGASGIPFFARKQVFDLLPLLIREFESSHALSPENPSLDFAGLPP